MKSLNQLTNSYDPKNTIQLWTPFIIFFLIHQTEEVLFSLKAWRQTIVLPRWASFTDRSPVDTVDSQGQTALLLVVGPFIALLTLAYLLRKNMLATKLAISALLSVLMLAFIMHIAVSLATRSFMPGVYTSIFPGLPIGGYLFGWVWRKPNGSER